MKLLILVQTEYVYSQTLQNGYKIKNKGQQQNGCQAPPILDSLKETILYIHKIGCYSTNLGFPGGSDRKEFTFNAGDPGSIPGWERSPGEGNGNPL